MIEEGLRGPEVSLCAWPTVAPWCRSHRRRTTSASATATWGPTPAGWARTHPLTRSEPERAESWPPTLVQPTLDELRRRGVDYRGVLYAGLMLTDDGPKVLEFNVRFGDPEAQVVLPRLDSDLAVLLHDVAAGGLRVGATLP